MKKALICIQLIFSFSILSAQSSYEPSSLYYARQPSAKAEAMGKGLVANINNDFGSYYNPASTSLSKGLTAFGSYSEGYFFNYDAKYNYVGLSYNFDKIGSFGLSRYYAGSGTDYIFYNGNDVNFKLYTLNYSREIFKNFFAGANLNIVTAQTIYVTEANPNGTIEKAAFTFDIGLLKKFQFESTILDRSEQIILAATIINPASARVQVYNMYKDIPVIARMGIGHNLKIFRNTLVKNTNVLNMFSQIELEKKFNSGALDLIKAATDVTLYDIVSLRGGFYHKLAHKADDAQTELTYGVGLNIPVDKFSDGKYPFKVNIDYVNLAPQSFYDNYSYNNLNYNLFSLKLTWLPE
jgi:hypothetical protein